MITSMLDMFTIILVFLLNFLDPTSDPAEDVDLPSASAALAIEPGVVLTISGSAVLVDGSAVLSLIDGAIPTDEGALAAVGARLSARRQASGDAAARVLLIQCDRGAAYGPLSELLTVAGDAGFEGFRFVVLDATD